MTANFPIGTLPTPPGVTLLLGGMHGDEPATIALLEDFCTYRLPSIKEPVAVVPLANPDGFAADSRYNSRGVDLNRNFPHRWSPYSLEPSGSGPLSEPESVALNELLLLVRPAKLVSLHWALAEVEADGSHGNVLAEEMWATLSAGERAPYRLRLYDLLNPPEDYCPGSLGQ